MDVHVTITAPLLGTVNISSNSRVVVRELVNGLLADEAPAPPPTTTKRPRRTPAAVAAKAKPAKPDVEPAYEDGSSHARAKARREALFTLMKKFGGPCTFSQLLAKYDEPGLSGDEKTEAVRRALYFMRDKDGSIERAGQNWCVKR